MNDVIETERGRPIGLIKFPQRPRRHGRAAGRNGSDKSLMSHRELTTNGEATLLDLSPAPGLTELHPEH